MFKDISLNQNLGDNSSKEALSLQRAVLGRIGAPRERGVHSYLDFDVKNQNFSISQEKLNQPIPGLEKETSVLFVDIADYTAFTEQTPAHDVAQVLSRYFNIAGNIIKENHGRIIDYYGDGFLAIFGLDGNLNHAENLIKAGFTLQEAIENFDHKIPALKESGFRIRLGAHTGKVIWGTIGIEGMQKKAAIGDTVNFASRLEQANKTLNTEFLISESLHNQFDNWSTISGNYDIEVKGKKGIHKVYALDRMLDSTPI